VVLTSAQQVSFWVLRPAAQRRRSFSVDSVWNKLPQFVQSILFTAQTQNDNVVCERQLRNYGTEIINFRLLTMAAAAPGFAQCWWRRKIQRSDERLSSETTASVSVANLRQNCKQIMKIKMSLLRHGYLTSNCRANFMKGQAEVVLFTLHRFFQTAWLETTPGAMVCLVIDVDACCQHCTTVPKP